MKVQNSNLFKNWSYLNFGKTGQSFVEIWMKNWWILNVYWEIIKVWSLRILQEWFTSRFYNTFTQIFTRDPFRQKSSGSKIAFSVLLFKTASSPHLQKNLFLCFALSYIYKLRHSKFITQYQIRMAYQRYNNQLFNINKLLFLLLKNASLWRH